jgi:hypothetical protein
MRGIPGSPGKRALVLLLVLPVLASAVLGNGVLIQPDTIVDGNQFSFILTGIPDGNSINATLVATFPAASPTSWFNITNWKYDFSLQKGNIAVIGGNVNRIILLVRVGSTFRMAEDTGAGNIRVEIPMDILSDVYHDYRIMYEVHNSSVPVSITIIQAGSKVGPEDSASTPFIAGAGGGNLYLEVLVNGALEGSQAIRVNHPSALPTNTPQITTVPQPTSQTPSPSPPTISVTVPGTTFPVIPNPPAQTTLVPPTLLPTQGPEGGASPWIIGYASLVIVITILADYYLLKD